MTSIFNRKDKSKRTKLSNLMLRRKIQNDASFILQSKLLFKKKLLSSHLSLRLFCAATKAWSTCTAWSARTKCLCMTCCWRCWTLTASTALWDQLRPGLRLTRSPAPPAVTTTAAAVVAPLQLAPVQDHEAATRAWAEPRLVRVSCSMEGPVPTAPTSYETEHNEHVWRSRRFYQWCV